MIFCLKDEKASETPKDTLGELFPSDEDEHGKQEPTLHNILSGRFQQIHESTTLYLS